MKPGSSNRGGGEDSYLHIMCILKKNCNEVYKDYKPPTHPKNKTTTEKANRDGEMEMKLSF